MVPVSSSSRVIEWRIAVLRRVRQRRSMWSAELSIQLSMVCSTSGGMAVAGDGASSLGSSGGGLVQLRGARQRRPVFGQTHRDVDSRTRRR